MSEEVDEYRPVVNIGKVLLSDGTLGYLGDVQQRGQMSFSIRQTGLTATKNVYAALPLGFAGKIVGAYMVYTTGAGSSSGVGTLDFILSTAGQVQSAAAATITLTLSNSAAVGTVVNQSAVPALQNTFLPTDTLTIHYTQTTTFASDTGVVEVHLITSS